MSRYATESTAQTHDAEHRIDLATALTRTPDGDVEHPLLFTGFLTRPDVAAAGILAVADVAGTRYADVGAGARLASLDPVITASGDLMRFESFSADNGVHARLDLLPEALGSADVGFGTTNVDINPATRLALAQIHRGEALHLTVGTNGLTASSISSTHVERRVELPDRWVRALAEVPSMMARMEVRADLTSLAVRRLFASLPRVQPPGPELHLVPVASDARVVASPVPGSVPIPGVTRLRGADRILRHVRRLTVHADEFGSTAWVFDLGDSRLTIALTPGPFRSFAGEGQLLGLLARDDAAPAGRRLLLALDWSPTIDPVALEPQTGLAEDEVTAGLAWLAASGRVGYDLTDQAWFHRELPIDAEQVIRDHPRLVAARRLARTGAVVGRGEFGWTVAGSRRRPYDVAPDFTCTCAWRDAHLAGRGPCKHVLAVLILNRP